MNRTRKSFPAILASSLGIRLSFASLLAWTLLAGTASANGGDPALPGRHPLERAQAGDLLISEFRCAACHAGIERNAIPAKSAPDLSAVGERVSPEYLRRFLASPLTAHPGTTMPDLLASKSEEERNRIAEALTHFLVAQSSGVFQVETAQPIDRLEGRALFHSVGCVACHGPREALEASQGGSKRNDGRDDAYDGRDDAYDEKDDSDETLVAKEAVKPDAVPLTHVGAKYSAKSLSEFLFQPLRVRPSGRMPDMKLTPAESLAIAGYLIGDQTPSVTALVPDANLVKEGAKRFQELDCAACHSLPGVTAAPKIGSLEDADLTRGCLSKTSVRSPRFSFDDAQAEAIVAALSDDSTNDSEEVAIAKTLTAFRCTACHVREDYGGVPDDYDAFFRGTQPNLGDDGRIPPPLTHVGAKLRPAWMKKVLFDGESVRPYMATRMPLFGAENLRGLSDLFSRVDVSEDSHWQLPNPESRVEIEREREKLMRQAGRELVGDKGLNCVACHNFNGKASPGNQGIDLTTSYARLQPAWFDSYLRNPGAFRPRTVMPAAWPNGEAFLKSVLDGDTDRQIEAVWYYLSLGTSAPDPSGIRAVSTRLTVGDRAETYRGRSRVAGFRGIAVGFPEKLNYAFNAETGTLSAIWQGDFIEANWSGQGSGDFRPSAEPILMPQDVSFAKLVDEEAPWPLLPVTTQQVKTNPDPLYPKNVGYQFRGYYFDEASVPTFQYRVGAVEVEDRSAAAGPAGQVRLDRVLRFDSPAPESVWFRALVGDIVQESDQVFRNERLRLTIPEVETKLRPLTGDPMRSELLLRLRIPQGDSSSEFIYEPLRK